MKYSEARQGRTFIIRLEHGEVIHESLERFAAEQGIETASVTVIGGADQGSTLVVGPIDDGPDRIVPQETVLSGVHEVTGTGTIALSQDGHPRLHMHIAAGRGDRTVTGCVRRGVITWTVLEIIITELVGASVRRRPDPASGLELLTPEQA